MHLALLVSLTMVAFAANSLLTRAAVHGAATDPGSFAVIRVAAGALVLVALSRAQGQAVPLRISARI